MSDKVVLVDYQESLSIKVGRFLLAKGFDLASCTGLALKSNSLIKTNSLGILMQDTEAKPRKYLFGLIPRKPRRVFIGRVWFNNSACCASEQNWILEAYGRKYVELVRKLVEDMTLTFNVKIALRLVREQPDVEIFRSDGDM